MRFGIATRYIQYIETCNKNKLPKPPALTSPSTTSSSQSSPPNSPSPFSLHSSCCLCWPPSESEYTFSISLQTSLIPPTITEGRLTARASLGKTNHAESPFRSRRSSKPRCICTTNSITSFPIPKSTFLPRAPLSCRGSQ